MEKNIHRTNIRSGRTLFGSQEQLIYTLTTDAQKLEQFVTETYKNQNAEPMEYIIGNNSITITEKVFPRKYVNTVYNHGKNGVLSVTDNNHLIVKAFAAALKYRELYELLYSCQ